MKDENVEFYLFGNNKGNAGLGIRQVPTDKPGFSCPFVGLVVYKITDEQLMALCEIEDGIEYLGITDIYDPFVTTAGVLRSIGMDLGEWEFGFLGDATPKNDDKMLMLVTDSLHLVWLHYSVE